MHSPPSHDFAEAIALTPDLARQQRAAALLAKFCDGGDLTPQQWEEIREVHPGFSSATPPPSVVAAVETAVAADDAFHLESSPGKFTPADLDKFGEWYGKKQRQIRRWVELGQTFSDPCPLDDPAQMPDWWARRMKHRCPQPILDRATAARATAPPPPVAEGAIPAVIAPAPPVGTGLRIDLAELDPEEGDRLRELKQVQAAKFKELANAFAGGNETAALESRYVKLCEAVDKMETRVVERLKKQGRYILRDVVDAALAANAELLRQSHESMKRRVLERCPSLSAAQREEVGRAVEFARATEVKTLSRIPELNDDELEFELAS